MIDFMKCMDWAAEGWTEATVVVAQPRSGAEGARSAWEHADAPGLCVLDVGGDLSITHKATGMRAVTFYRDPHHPVCPRHLREVMAQACQIIDYASLTLDNITKVPVEARKGVSNLFENLYRHTSCSACERWEEVHLSEIVKAVEEEIQDWEFEVGLRQRAVDDAQGDLDEALAELRKVEKKRDQLKEKAHGRG